MKWRSVVASMLCTGLFGAHAAAAQPWPEPGSRIRILARSGQMMTGQFIRLVADSVEVVPDGEFQSRFLPLTLMRRLEVSRGRTSGAIKGMVLGGASGVALAGLVVLTNPGGAGDFSRGQAFLLAAGWLGVIGVGSGVVIGAFFTVEDWRRMPMTLEHTVGFVAPPRGGLRVQLTF